MKLVRVLAILAIAAVLSGAACHQSFAAGVAVDSKVSGVGGDGITTIGIRSTGTGAYDLQIVNAENLTASRAITVKMNDAARTLDLGGNLVLAGTLTTSGAYATTLTATGATAVTLPTAGTLATLAGAETFANKTLTTPVLSTASPASGAACTAGQVAWDTGYVYVCTASGAWKRAALTGGY